MWLDILKHRRKKVLVANILDPLHMPCVLFKAADPPPSSLFFSLSSIFEWIIDLVTAISFRVWLHLSYHQLDTDIGIILFGISFMLSLSCFHPLHRFTCTQIIVLTSFRTFWDRKEFCAFFIHSTYQRTTVFFDCDNRKIQLRIGIRVLWIFLASFHRKLQSNNNMWLSSRCFPVKNNPDHLIKKKTIFMIYVRLVMVRFLLWYSFSPILV